MKTYSNNNSGRLAALAEVGEDQSRLWHDGSIVRLLPEVKVVPAATAIDAIKTERDRRIQSGGYKVGAFWFHSDTLSRSQQLGLVAMGAAIRDGLQWKTMGGAFVGMSQALAGQILAAAGASDAAIFAIAESKIAAATAANGATRDEIYTGWPPAYWE